MCRSRDQVQEALRTWTASISSVGISGSEVSTSTISSTSTWIASAGQGSSASEIVQPRGQTTRLYFTMDRSMYSQGMMAALGTTTSGNVRSKDRNTSGN